MNAENQTWNQIVHDRINIQYNIYYIYIYKIYNIM